MKTEVEHRGAGVFHGREALVEGARCEQAARHLLIHNRVIPYAEIVARIEAVDQEAVRRVAGRLLRSRLTLAALGPIDELESLDKIAARLAA